MSIKENMNELTFLQRVNIKSNMDRLSELFKTEVLLKQNPNNLVFLFSVLTEVLIIIRDLTKKAEMIGKRIDFKNDVDIDKKLGIEDVTDLIKVFRDCFCHVETNKKNYNETTKVDKIFIPVGRLKILNFESQYVDDSCVIMGKSHLYIKRHILRTYSELKTIFKDILINVNELYSDDVV